jgi:plastocyanin
MGFSIRHMMRRPSTSSPAATLRIAGIGVAAALGLAACGGSSGSDEPAATLPPTVDLTVKAVPTIRWDKPSYTAPAGEIEVGLINEDSIRHDLVILDGDTKVGDLELITRARGDIDTGTVTLDAGTYTIFCIVPGHAGMRSDLVVS